MRQPERRLNLHWVLVTYCQETDSFLNGSKNTLLELEAFLIVCWMIFFFVWLKINYHQLIIITLCVWTVVIKFEGVAPTLYLTLRSKFNQMFIKLWRCLLCCWPSNSKYEKYTTCYRYDDGSCTVSMLAICAFFPLCVAQKSVKSQQFNVGLLLLVWTSYNIQVYAQNSDKSHKIDDIDNVVSLTQLASPHQQLTNFNNLKAYSHRIMPYYYGVFPPNWDVCKV